MQSALLPAIPVRILGKAYGKMHAIRRRIGMHCNNFEARHFDVRYGTNTAGKTDFQQLDVDGDSVPHGTGYQAVNARHFDAVIRSLDIPPNSGFLDIGCGKGKPLLLASRHPNFATVRGVELSQSLCDIAQSNAARFGGRAPASAQVEVIQADAARFEIPADINVIFINNPFDDVIMRKLLDNIAQSITGTPRRVWFLYYNPVFGDLIGTSGLFETVKHHRFFGPGRDLRVYVSRP